MVQVFLEYQRQIRLFVWLFHVPTIYVDVARIGTSRMKLIA